MDAWPHRRLSRGQAAGYAAYALAGVLLFCQSWRLPGGMRVPPAVVPLFLYVAVTIAASFYPSWSWFLPIVCHGSRDRRAIALSFDDGPDPATTLRVLELLARHGVKAAFFVVGQSAQAHPELVQRISEQGHEIGNHSMSHDYLLMLSTTRHLEAEIAACQATLLGLGIRPLAFRPPVGITNPRLPLVLDKLELGCICFSCRPLDFGNRRVHGLSDKVLASARPGDIVLLHDVTPDPGVSVETWLGEIEKVVVGLRERGFELVALSELIGLPLMAPRDAVAAVVARPAPAPAGGA